MHAKRNGESVFPELAGADPEQNVPILIYLDQKHVADSIFKYIFFGKNYFISTKM